MLPEYRLFGRWLVVAVDGTGVVSFNERHCEHGLHRTSKTGKTTYFHPVLEAKLITATGLAISLVTEWIANPAGEYDQHRIVNGRRLSAWRPSSSSRIPGYRSV